MSTCFWTDVVVGEQRCEGGPPGGELTFDGSGLPATFEAGEVIDGNVLVIGATVPLVRADVTAGALPYGVEISLDNDNAAILFAGQALVGPGTRYVSVEVEDADGKVGTYTWDFAVTASLINPTAMFVYFGDNQSQTFRGYRSADYTAGPNTQLAFWTPAGHWNTPGQPGRFAQFDNGDTLIFPYHNISTPVGPPRVGVYRRTGLQWYPMYPSNGQGLIGTQRMEASEEWAWGGTNPNPVNDVAATPDGARVAITTNASAAVRMFHRQSANVWGYAGSFFTFTVLGGSPHTFYWASTDRLLTVRLQGGSSSATVVHLVDVSSPYDHEAAAIDEIVIEGALATSAVMSADGLHLTLVLYRAGDWEVAVYAVGPDALTPLTGGAAPAPDEPRRAFYGRTPERRLAVMTATGTYVYVWDAPGGQYVEEGYIEGISAAHLSAPIVHGSALNPVGSFSGADTHMHAHSPAAGGHCFYARDGGSYTLLGTRSTPSQNPSYIGNYTEIYAGVGTP